MSTASFQQFRDGFLPQWDQLFARIFPIAVPARAEWRDLQQIITVLSFVGSTPSLNHTFFPDSGGEDLTAAVAANENGLLELCFDGNVKIVSPCVLTCETFPGNSEWSYFRLETDVLTPSGIDGSTSDMVSEEVVELSPGEYCSRSGWDDRLMFGDGTPFPPSARVVSRELSGGAFVIFCKASCYNLHRSDHDAYDAVHNELNAIEFRDYVVSLANRTQGARI